MSSLKTVLDGVTEDGGVWRFEGAEGWSQGRTLFGGMTLALCAHVASRALTELPALRSAQVAFVGPAAGPLTLTATELRRGRSATIAAVDCAAASGLAARAILTYGGPRESAVAHDRTPAPSRPEPEECPPFLTPDRAENGFFRQFEMRAAGGTRPFEGGAPDYRVWVRLKDAAGVDAVIGLLAIADSLPPAAMSAFPAPAPISTMTWSIDLSPPVASDGWLLLSSSSEQAQDGYSLQAMNVWDASGRRLATGRQVVAIFA